jgi:hypothetical protein
MARMPKAFNIALKSALESFGQAEFDIEQVLPLTMELMLGHGVNNADLLRKAARAILDSHFRKEDAIVDPNEPNALGQQQMFRLPYDNIIALGDNKKIRRGYQNDFQIITRQRLIDKVVKHHVAAYEFETAFNSKGRSFLKGHSPTTVLRDVLPESDDDAAAA